MCQFTPYYNPSIGRFISEDSYWGKNTDPLSLNLYTYCYNNPVRYQDPDGHWVIDALFLAYDIYQFSQDQTIGNAAWIAFDIATFGDGSGLATSVAHGGKALKAAKALLKEGKLAEIMTKIEKGGKAFLQETKYFVNDIKYSSKYADFAKTATQNAKSSTSTVVLGKYVAGSASSYDQVAKYVFDDATYFYFKDWNSIEKEVGNGNMWKINKAFLEQQFQAGKTFVLSHDPFKAEGFFKQEVDFLFNKGYKFVQDGSYWKAIKK